MSIRQAVAAAFATITLAGATASAGPGGDGGRAFRAACATEIAKFCQDVPRGKALHQCVRSHHAEMTPSCSEFLYERRGGRGGMAPMPQNTPPPQNAPSPAPQNDPPPQAPAPK